MLLTHPAFQLFSASLKEVVLQGIWQKVFLPAAGGDEDVKRSRLSFPGQTIPVALRWTTHPEFGFPRKPFNVYRRPGRYPAGGIRRLVENSAQAVNVWRSFDFHEELFVMAISCDVPAGQSLVLTPIGRDNTLMKAKKYTLTAAGTVLFKAPFMTGIQCEGMGTVTSLVGVTMQSVLNASDWQHIQVVGLPFKTGVVGGLGYDGDPQGFVPALLDAESAARLRLKLGQWLFMPPPSVSAADPQCPDVNWKHPEANDYLKFLQTEQLPMINDCLTNCDDYSWVRETRQVFYKKEYTVDGLHQPGGGPPQPAKAVIPVVNHTLLSVTNESPASLGLGFGTYDFPSMKQPGIETNEFKMMKTYAAASSQQLLGMDYMVTAAYVVRPFEKFEFSFLEDLSRELVFAALNDERALPVTPEQLDAIGIQLNRPETRDAPYTQSVKLRWNQSVVPQGYGTAANYKAGSSTQVMNDAYPFDKDCYKNFFTPVPKVNGVEQDPGDVGRFIINATEEPIPLYGSETHKYFVAGWDVFGRWSGWSKKNFMAAAPQPQQPGIMALNLVLRPGVDLYTLAPSQSPVPCQLEIEFGWDWIDRSPSVIQIAGTFFDAALTEPPPGVPSFFGLKTGDTTTPVIEVHFPLNDPTVVPVVASPYQISIMHTNVPAVPSDPVVGSSDVPANNLVRYKLIIPNIDCSFPGGPPYQVAYAAYIRGLERVRIPVNEYSDWNPWDIPFDLVNRKKIQYTTQMDDPRPPAITTLPATVKFTAMPDAAKTARGKLTWPTATNAIGYHIWEASETAIRATLDKQLKQEFPSDSTKHLRPLSEPLTDRATQLRDLLAQPKYSEPCQRFFSRVNKEPVLQPAIELSLPGSADILFLYQVSSVNSANIESKKSNVIFFAVPQVIVPASPLLQVRRYKKKLESDPVGEGIEVKVVSTIGEEPLGYHLYRVRKKIAGNDVGMKGLPVYLETDAQWIDTEITFLNGTSYKGKKINDLGVSKSWRPFVYQAVAIGRADPERGLYSGISGGSTTELIYFPPDIPPAIVSAGLPASNAFCTRFEIDTSAPFEMLDLGKTRIEIFELDSNNQRVLKGSFIAHEVTEAATPVPLATNAGAADALPAISHTPVNHVTGITRFSLCVKGSPVKMILRITDPLNRSGEIQLES
ncbi:hypothetical protein [Niabella drilacis]|uniref:Uncharacterized protein n=1 Tax=Niabella drilacis (strain DSM 25811 / CCM 8410 / CCUG 62505 / LMG 26954 / E90) TaxID=1285928 RepID=A0A1G6SXG4_NIADE|nr:hypothetical protein [Niabella drilacis]SDD21294.1 hypothetical protein SAMN04487894_1072 [Niabella drilacis]